MCGIYTDDETSITPTETGTRNNSLPNIAEARGVARLGQLGAVSRANATPPIIQDDRQPAANFHTELSTSSENDFGGVGSSRTKCHFWSGKNKIVTSGTYRYVSWAQNVLKCFCGLAPPRPCRGA